ncbi:hypothetical protein HY734_00600 [Candidatus Uhrbacteria bacterium]|nr:hypothetical protein [Candidatus Uhrbacteria bacterium]
MVDDAVRRIAAYFGINIDPSEEVIYDEVRGPGSGGHVMGADGGILSRDVWWGRILRLLQRFWCFLTNTEYENLWEDRRSVLRQVKKYWMLHGQNLIILSTHWGCGREGDHKHDPVVLLTHLLQGMRRIKRCLPDMKVAAMFLRIGDDGQKMAEIFVTEDALEQRIEQLIKPLTDASVTGAV